MDENLFRDAYRSANPDECAFEKAVLSQTCHCSLSSRVCVADRQGVACTDTRSRELCRQFLDALRQHSRFALKLTHLPPRLPHAQEIRVQLGGVRGVRELLDPQAEDAAVTDIITLLRDLLARYGAIESVPYQSVVAHVAAVSVRRRRS